MAEQGRWVENRDIWATPAEFVREQLDSMRRKIPESLVNDLPAEVIPDDHEIGKPYPLDLEILFFLVGGDDFVGDSKRSMLKPYEFIEALRATHTQYEEAEITRLTDGNFAVLSERINNNNVVFQEQIELTNKSEIHSILDSWTPERIKVFCELSNRSMDATTEAAIESMHKALLERVGDTRTEQLQLTIQTYLDMASPLFSLTPGEMKDITRKERSYGYLFLDSLVDMLPQLDMQYEAALRFERDLQINGIAEHDDMFLLDHRNEVIAGLMLGAKSSNAVRSDAERLFGAGASAGDQKETFPRG